MATSSRLRLWVAAFEHEHGKACPDYRDKPELVVEEDACQDEIRFTCSCGADVRVDEWTIRERKRELLDSQPRLGVVLRDATRPRREQYLQERVSRYYNLAADITGGGLEFLDRFDDWCRMMKTRHADMDATIKAIRGSKFYDRPCEIGCQGEEDGDV